MKNNTPRSKLTVRIWDRLFNLLEERTSEICLRRDALLERVIDREIDRLREELPEPNSDVARAHIEHHLKLLIGGSKKQITLSLSPNTATKLEEICSEKNVPREAFLNRLILLLVAKPSFLDKTLFGLSPKEANELRVHIKNQMGSPIELENSFAPLPIMSAILSDPFGMYRELVAQLSEDAKENYTLYGMPFLNESLLGLNCHIPDMLVPGTSAYLEAQQQAENMLAELGDEKLFLVSEGLERDSIAKG